MKTVTKTYVGVDISKDFLDVALTPAGKHYRVSNNEEGIKSMIRKISSYSIARIVCESSGGYERKMLRLLRKSQYHVSSVDPKLIRYFILSKKIKAKTDKIDAQMIALYASANEFEYVQPVLSDKHEELRDMVRRRHDFVEDIAREKTRIQQAILEKSKKFISQHIEYIEKQIKLVDAEIRRLIKSDTEWQKRYKIFTSIPGIGEISAATLLSEMAELGHLENKQAAALLGVAPRTKQSGTYEGKATISGGRFVVRKIMYMAALSASHAKGKFGEYYKRLKSKGKKGKVCVVALMNKMICIANTLIRKGEMWNPAFV